jgi:ABC-type nitrate/sulfonate/bicarbonate transport system ATPase subunit
MQTEPRTMLLVTHDVEEALLLCDRVAVLSSGRIATTLEVDVPRHRTDVAFVELRERALEALA